MTKKSTKIVEHKIVEIKKFFWKLKYIRDDGKPGYVENIVNNEYTTDETRAKRFYNYIAANMIKAELTATFPTKEFEIVLGYETYINCQDFREFENTCYVIGLTSCSNITKYFIAKDTDKFKLELSTFDSKVFGVDISNAFQFQSYRDALRLTKILNLLCCLHVKDSFQVYCYNTSVKNLDYLECLKIATKKSKS